MILKSSEQRSSERPGLVQAGRKIEEESFKIIEDEMGDHGFSPGEWQIVRRVIHSTGDFDYAGRIRVGSKAISSGMKALRAGACIYADTRMIRAGVAPWRLEWFGNALITPVDSLESQEDAVRMGTTRTMAAFRRCADDLDGSVIAVGNAPTALQEVIRMIESDGVRPALVIGVPVGFVQAEETKDALWRLDHQPSITVLGRKGGSTVAVAILHALFEIAKNGY